jgi:(R,R)-butanediol dehydrogenase/meso-butanediol dehydrogenase/diacetyl reductase
MRAVRFHGKEDLRVEEVPEPAPGPGEVQIRNAFSGICGSDLHVFFDPEHSGLDLTRPHPLTGAMPPQILGHEFSGVVAELGEGVSGLAIGDNVAVWPIYYCGACAACEKGRYNICRRIAFHGLSSNGGGMAELTTVPSEKVHRLPANVSLEMGALVEPMAVGWHAVAESGVQAGGSALVAGAGPIGIGVWFALRARGVERLIVSEPSATRQEAIRRLGADVVVDPTSEDLAARVQEVTDGRGVDVAFDAAGAGAAIAGALGSLGPDGTLMVVALHERPMEFNPVALVWSELGMRGTLAYLQRDFDEVIDAMARGLYSMDGWVESVGFDAAEQSMHRLRAGDGMKILIAAG